MTVTAHPHRVAALQASPFFERCLGGGIVFLASGLARHATGTTIDVNGASYVR